MRENQPVIDRFSIALCRNSSHRLIYHRRRDRYRLAGARRDAPFESRSASIATPNPATNATRVPRSIGNTMGGICAGVLFIQVGLSVDDRAGHVMLPELRQRLPADPPTALFRQIQTAINKEPTGVGKRVISSIRSTHSHGCHASQRFRRFRMLAIIKPSPIIFASRSSSSARPMASWLAGRLAGTASAGRLRRISSSCVR